MASICRSMARVGIDEYVYGCRLMTRVMISDSEQRCCRLYDCEAGMASVTVSTIARRRWELLVSLSKNKGHGI